jgi:hypothetical protein
LRRGRDYQSRSGNQKTDKDTVTKECAKECGSFYSSG